MTQGYRFYLVFCLVTFVKLAASETTEPDTTDTTSSQYLLSAWTYLDPSWRILIEAHSTKDIILARNSLGGCGERCWGGFTGQPLPPQEYPYTYYYDTTMMAFEGSCSAPDAALTQSIDFCPDCYDPENPSKTRWQTLYASFHDPYNNVDDMFDDSYFNPSIDVATGLCGQRWSSSFYQYLSTAAWSDSFTPAITECPVWATTSSSTFITGFNKNVTFNFPGFPFTPSSPCCEGCSFTVGNAQVYQWPASTNGAPFVSTLINAAGVTFVYPSIYIHFDTIAATDSCGIVGSTIDSATTIAFDPKHLSTANSYFWNSTLYTGRMFSNNYTQFNPANDITCIDITTTLYFVPGAWVATVRTTSGTLGLYDILGYSDLPNGDAPIYTLSPFPATYNPCKPWLSAPQEIFTLDPRWITCSRAIQAVHDPRSALTPGGPFTPVTTRTSAYHPQTPVASAGAYVTPDFPTQTGLTVPNSASRVREDPSAPQVPQPSKLPAVATILKTIIVTADSNSEFDIDGQTFKPGEQIVVSETTISWATDGNALVVDGTTQQLNPSYGIGTQIIYEGGPAATAANNTYSLDVGGSSIVVDGLTEAASAATAGNAVTKTCVPAYIKDGQTLIAGGLPITSSGTVLSLEPGGKRVVIVVSQTEDIDALWGGSNSVETASGGEGDSGGGSASGGGSVSSTPLGNSEGSSSVVDPPSIVTTIGSKKVHNGSYRGVETDIAALLLMISVMIGAYLAL